MTLRRWESVVLLTDCHDIELKQTPLRRHFTRRGALQHADRVVRHPATVSAMISTLVFPAARVRRIA